MILRKWEDCLLDVDGIFPPGERNGHLFAVFMFDECSSAE